MKAEPKVNKGAEIELITPQAVIPTWFSNDLPDYEYTSDTLNTYIASLNETKLQVTELQ